MRNQSFRNYLVMLSVLALISACQQLNHPPSMKTYVPSTYTDPCLMIDLIAPDSLRAGSQVVVEISLRNSCTTAFTVSYDDLFDLLLVDAQGNVKWQYRDWSLPRATLPLPIKQFEPDEAVSATIRWNGKGGSNQRLNAGEYQLVALVGIGRHPEGLEWSPEVDRDHSWRDALEWHRLDQARTLRLR